MGHRGAIREDSTGPSKKKISLFFIVEIISFPLTWGKGQRVLKNEKNLGIIEGISAMLGLAAPP